MHFILEAFQPWRELKANSALGPFAVFHNHILSDKRDRRRPANELVLFRAGLRRDQRKVCGAVRRGNGHKTTNGLNARATARLAAEWCEGESQGERETANVNGHRLQPQVRGLAVQADRGAVCPLPRTT